MYVIVKDPFCSLSYQGNTCEYDGIIHHCTVPCFNWIIDLLSCRRWFRYRRAT